MPRFDEEAARGTEAMNESRRVTRDVEYFGSPGSN
jgi:hypothetical protein